MIEPNALLGLPAFPASAYAPLAGRLKALLQTKSDVVFVQAEAIVALEAAAHSLARPGLVALNIVTSPYGRFFGEWLRRGGAEVHDLDAVTGKPITIEAVTRTFASLKQIDLVAAVHAETSTGILNPLPEIAAAARARNALLMVDAVASVGGHEVAVDQWGIDVCVTGPQKSLGGPAGLSIVSVSSRAWAAIEKSGKPSPSTLNLLDLKTGWLDKGQGVVPGMPSAIEFWALDAALKRVEDETLPSVIARHAMAAKATRAGIKGLGLAPWVDGEAQASALATGFELPPDVDAQQVIAKAASLGAVISPSYGALAARVLRIDHTGARAQFAPALANIMTLGLALESLGVKANMGAAAEEFAAIYRSAAK